MIYKRTLGITFLRVGISLLLIKDFITFSIFSNSLFGKNGIVPLTHYFAVLKKFNIAFLSIPFGMSYVPLTACLIGLFLSICFLLGFHRVLAGLLLCALLFILKMRNVYILDGADNVISATLMFLSLSYSKPFVTSYFSLPSGYRINAVRRIIQVLSVYALMIQFSFVYLFAALDKLMSSSWQDGTALYYALRIHEFMASNLNVYLTKSAFFTKTMSYTTIIWEVSFPLLIWFRKLRPYIVLISMMMHIGILFLMRIDNYSVLMILFYPLYFKDEELLIIFQKFNINLTILRSKFLKLHA